MITSIIITSLSKATSMPYKPDLQQNVWITTVDPEDEKDVKKLNSRFSEKGIKHFPQYFRDWSDEDPEPFIKDRLEIEGPQESHVNNIISFLEPLVASDTHYNLGINCFAGISRSTAIGIIAWVMQGKTVEEALQAVVDVRSVAWPNERMLRFASARLGKNILTPIIDWKQEETKKGLLIPHEL